MKVTFSLFKTKIKIYNSNTQSLKCPNLKYPSLQYIRLGVNK